MPEIGLEALSILIVLLPGFLTAKIVQGLCVRPAQTEFDKFVEALLYSFLVYVTYSLFQRELPAYAVLHDPAYPGEQRTITLAVNPGHLLLLLGVAVSFAVVVSASITNDLHGRVFRKARLTQRTTRSSIWSDVFHELPFYVQVDFSDGRKLIGWPRYYSDTPEEASLFLEKAAWITKDAKLIEIPGPGILVTKNMPIETIQFLSAKSASDPK